MVMGTHFAGMGNSGYNARGSGFKSCSGKIFFVLAFFEIFYHFLCEIVNCLFPSLASVTLQLSIGFMLFCVQLCYNTGNQRLKIVFQLLDTH